MDNSGSHRMEQLRKDVSEVILLESLNAQRIEKLHENMMTLKDTIRDSMTQFTASIATQAQALAGFRELYAREVAFIYQSLAGLRESVNEVRTASGHDKDKLTAVEKDIAAARGSVRSVIMTWSGFVSLMALILDKAVEIVARR